MLKTKRFVKPSYIIHHSKNQLGNTLIPVIIALAISAVASISFLKQGADLSAQAKVLEAQHELADITKNWQVLAASTKIGYMTPSPAFMEGQNIFGEDLAFIMGIPGSSKSTYFDVGINIFNYKTSNLKTCKTLRITFNENYQGIAKSQCDEETLQIIFNNGN
jgi:hypothetical protein